MEIVTGHNQDFQFNPINFGSLYFKVKAANDAYIALTNLDQRSPLYEIFIGCWANTKSSLCKNKSQPANVMVNTPNILNEHEARGFWIKWGHGLLSVGKQNEETPFIVWEDNEFPIFSAFGVCTDWGANGQWTIEAPSVSSPDYIRWVQAVEGIVPPNAVPCGYDAKNKELFMARAKHNVDNLIPGKLVPSNNTAYITWNGEEIAKNEYEVLCWCDTLIKAKCENITIDDTMTCEEPIKEAIKNNNYLQDNLFSLVTENYDFHSLIATTLKTLKSSSEQQQLKDKIILTLHNFVFEVVVKNENAPDLEHSSINSNSLHNKSIYEITTYFGQKYQFKPLNFGSIQFNLMGSDGAAYIALKERRSEENKSHNYEIFMNDCGKSSICCKNQNKMENVAVHTSNILSADEFKGFWITWGNGFISIGKQFQEKPFMCLKEDYCPVFSSIGVRTDLGVNSRWTIEDGPAFSRIEWVMASSGEVPQNALSGGFDSEHNQNLYIARAIHDGYIFPGKLVPQDGLVYISCDGVEIQKCDYEVLCKCSSWVKNTAIKMDDESDLDITNFLDTTHII